MLTQNYDDLIRVTVTLDRVDVDLLDRLAKIENANRSHELRGILSQLRPTLIATLDAFEAALAQRDKFDLAAARALVDDLEPLMTEVQQLNEQYIGAISRLEGHATAQGQASAGGAAAAPQASKSRNPRSSNTGVTPPPPTIQSPRSDGVA